MRFSFDPSRPPGSRIPVSSVSVGSVSPAPLDPSATYTLATKAYLAEGKDGYDVLDVSLAGTLDFGGKMPISP